MNLFLRLLIAVGIGVLAASVRFVGMPFLAPLAVALAVGWPLSLLVPRRRRLFVLATAVLVVQFALIASTDIGLLLGDPEAGRCAAWFFRIDAVPEPVGYAVGGLGIVVLGAFLCLTDRLAPRLLAVAVLLVLTARIGWLVRVDGWREVPPELLAHALLRLTELGLVVAGLVLAFDRGAAGPAGEPRGGEITDPSRKAHP